MLRTGSHRMRAGVALGVLALVLTACGSDDSSSPTGTPNESESTSAAGGDSTLVVWADNSANTGKAVEPLCKAWAEANGVTCVVKMFNGGPELEDALVRGNETGDVPDIYEGAARPHRQARRQRHPGSRRHLRERRQVREGGRGRDAVPGQLLRRPVGRRERRDVRPTRSSRPSARPRSTRRSPTPRSSSARARPPTASASPCRSVRPATSTPGTRSSPPTAATPSPATPTAPTTPTTWVSAPLVASRPPSGSSSSPTRASSSPPVSYDIARETFAGGKSPYFITGPWQVPEQLDALGDDLMVCPVPNWEGIGEHLASRSWGSGPSSRPPRPRTPRWPRRSSTTR